LLEECLGRWRVVLHEDLVKFFKRRGLERELEEWRKSLEDSLNGDPEVIMRLLREPILYEVDGIKRRRYRLYLRGKGYRLVYVIYPTLCAVYFLLGEKRDEETYTRIRRKQR
jgi:mRNA-degrading endonuclease RelE of RelBE toxin-antitoxin system